jgi:phosphate transport system permease protein
VSEAATAAFEDAAARGPLGSRSPRARARELGFKVLLWGCLAASMLLLGTLLVAVGADGLGRLSPSFVTDYASSVADDAGIRAALLGTLWLMAVCATFIVPVGVATAVYLEEYADGSRWWNRLIEINIQNLAAVPSIVYGILGLAFLVRGPLSLSNVVVAGGLTLGLLVLPVVIIASREAIRAVPPSIREGSMALGATQWQTVWRQVLPAAIPGIATGVILALSRAIGETAPLIMVGAATFVAFDPGLTSAFTALPIQIFEWISRPSSSVNDYESLAAGGIVVLMILLLGMNAVAIWLRNRYEHKW